MNSNSILSTPPKYLVYKIINNVNNKIYIGIHLCRCKYCWYMGSGKEIKKAIKEEGIENFSKEILFECNNKEEMLAKEREIVTDEFRRREDTYNIALGGRGFPNRHGYSEFSDETKRRMSESAKKKKPPSDITRKRMSESAKNIPKESRPKISEERKLLLSKKMKNLVTVKNKMGEVMHTDKNDPRYISGELVGITKNKVLVKDPKNPSLKCFHVDKNDPRYISGELVGSSKGIKCSDEFKRKNSNNKKGTVVVKDPNNPSKGNFVVSVNDPDYILKKFVPHNTGNKRSKK